MIKLSKPLAVIGITSTLSLIITDVDSTGGYVSSYFSGDNLVRRSKIRYDDTGRAYFIRGKARYYLDEAIKTERS